MENLIPLNIYKPPFNKLVTGFGYTGVILQTDDGEKIQCHICGKLFKTLAGHLRYGHDDMTVVEYKDQFQIARSTALVSPKFKEDRRVMFMENFNKEARDRRRANAIKVTKNQTTPRGLNRPMALEIKNQRGSCPDQIIQHVIKVAQEIGHTPSINEFARHDGHRFIGLIKRTFDTYSNALKIAKLAPRELKASQYITHKYSKEELLEYQNIFQQEFQRRPTYCDYGNGLLPAYTTYKRHQLV